MPRKYPEIWKPFTFEGPKSVLYGVRFLINDAKGSAQMFRGLKFAPSTANPGEECLKVEINHGATPPERTVRVLVESAERMNRFVVSLMDDLKADAERAKIQSPDA